MTSASSYRLLCGSGFTLVELALVITVMGILATMSTFAFNGWRDRVATTELKSDLNGIYSAMESAKNWGQGYPVISPGASFDGEDSETSEIFTQSENVTLTYASGNAQAYCVNAVSTARPTIKLFLNTAGGNKEPATGTCS